MKLEERKENTARQTDARNPITRARTSYGFHLILSPHLTSYHCHATRRSHHSHLTTQHSHHSHLTPQTAQTSNHSHLTSHHSALSSFPFHLIPLSPTTTLSSPHLTLTSPHRHVYHLTPHHFPFTSQHCLWLWNHPTFVWVLVGEVCGDAHHSPHHTFFPDTLASPIQTQCCSSLVFWVGLFVSCDRELCVYVSVWVCGSVCVAGPVNGFHKFEVIFVTFTKQANHHRKVIE
eukprot:GHVN01100831.1.p1 GENE.GHVN01100831.1~~GHVN01100831.1.p1  ORF type:complete len:232 (-),score=74.53 GHVN01100831.1:166-861(-)